MLLNTLIVKLDNLPRRYLYPIFGFFLALGAPVGWLVLCALSDRFSINSSPPVSVYSYLFIGSLVSFTIFSVLLGKAYDKIEDLVDEDSLTGLVNQRAFARITKLFLSVAEREETPLSILMLDLDFFKNVNDQFGHLKGSETLQAVSRVLRATTRTSDIVSRFGGDEFAICLPNSDSESAKIMAERIRQNIERTSFPGLNGQVLTVSLGGAEYLPHSETQFIELLDRSDQALYVAKNNGRNQVRFYTKI